MNSANLCPHLEPVDLGTIDRPLLWCPRCGATHIISWIFPTFNVDSCAVEVLCYIANEIQQLPGGIDYAADPDAEPAQENVLADLGGRIYNAVMKALNEK